MPIAYPHTSAYISDSVKACSEINKGNSSYLLSNIRMYVCVLTSSFVCLQIEDLKFKLSTTEEQLENNHQLQSELQLCKDHCVQLEESRNDLTKQLERARSDLIEVHTYIYVVYKNV